MKKMLLGYVLSAASVLGAPKGVDISLTRAVRTESQRVPDIDKTESVVITYRDGEIKERFFDLKGDLVIDKYSVTKGKGEMKTYFGRSAVNEGGSVRHARVLDEFVEPAFSLLERLAKEGDISVWESERRDSEIQGLLVTAEIKGIHYTMKRPAAPRDARVIAYELRISRTRETGEGLREVRNKERKKWIGAVLLRGARDRYNQP